MKRKHDLIILGSILILMVVSMFTLASTTLDSNGHIEWGGVLGKQAAFFLVGIAIYAFLSRSEIEYFKYPQISGGFYAVTLVLLAVTLLAGPVINNVQRWLIIGGVQIQASEIAKVAVLLLVASILSYRDRLNDVVLALISFGLLLPILFLVYKQPHGSMSLMIALLWATLIFTFLAHQLRNAILVAIIASGATGVILLFLDKGLLGMILSVASLILMIFAFYTREEWRKLFIVALIIGYLAGIVGVFSWDNILRDYQKDRIEGFFNPTEGEDDKTFNVTQSKIAVGSGGVWGKGFGLGLQSRLNFLPEHQTDFIFAAFSEQFGLLGSFTLLLVYAVLIGRTLWIGVFVAQRDFFSMVAVGVAIKLTLELFINVGTNVGIIPATGIPLPLVSAGGSSVLMTLFALGLVQGIYRVSENTEYQSITVDNEDLLI